MTLGQFSPQLINAPLPGLQVVGSRGSDERGVRVVTAIEEDFGLAAHRWRSA
jgi:hypothetical protein